MSQSTLRWSVPAWTLGLCTVALVWLARSGPSQPPDAVVKILGVSTGGRLPDSLLAKGQDGQAVIVLLRESTIVLTKENWATQPDRLRSGQKASIWWAGGFAKLMSEPPQMLAETIRIESE